jgi:hypothetical protein
VVFDYLREAEESLQGEVDFLQEEIDKLGDQATDDQKTELFAAINRYKYVSDKLGANSPAKAAAKA